MKKSVEPKSNSFWTFPEKINSLSLLVIIVLFAVLCVGIFGVVAWACPNDYQYIPEYTEQTYNEYYNPAVAITSNYTVNEKNLVKTNTTILCLYNVSVNRAKNINAKLVGLTKAGDVEYYDDFQYKSATNNTTNSIASLNTSTKQDYTDIFGKVSFDSYLDTDSTITRRVIKFRETILTLSEKDIPESLVNDMANNPEIFTKYVASVTENTSNYSISLQFQLNTNVVAKYHLDFQLFAVDKDQNVYTLVGYYNLSNSVSREFKRTVNFPFGYNLEYLVCKANFTDANGELKTYYAKTAFTGTK